MKIAQKVGVILIIALCVLIVIPQNVSNAALTDIVGSMTGEQPEDSMSSDLVSTLNKVLGFLQVAAALVSVIVIAATGFQYIVSDTPDMKQELKKKMLPIILGMVCVFGASSIAKFILAAVGG